MTVNLLALTAVSDICQVAWCPVGGDPVMLTRPRTRSGAEVLAPLLRELFTAHPAIKNNLDGIAADCGPGSFTGMRVTLAAAMGLSEAWDKPIFGVPYHAAAALVLQAAPLTSLAITTADGKGGFHTALMHSDGRLLWPITAQAQPCLPPELAVDTVRWFGPGAELGQKNSGGVVDNMFLPPVTAAMIGLYAQRFWTERGQFPPTPLYLRGASVTMPDAA